MAVAARKAQKSYKLLDQDDWFTNFTYVEGHEDGSTQILFTVSASRTTGRWFGYVFSLGISAAQGGNTLSEMSIEARGVGAESVIEQLYSEYELGQHQISPDMIKTAIRRNGWFVEDYQYGQSLMACTTGSRIHIIVQKNPPGATTSPQTPASSTEATASTTSIAGTVLFGAKPKLYELDYLESSNGKHKVSIIERIQANWQALSSHLRLPSHTIGAIKGMPGYSPENACREVFRRWLDGGNELRTPKSWDTVMNVIRNIGNAALADEIHTTLKG